ncbi:hypothetical protein [Tropicimonas sp. IMCC34043]|uniref:hypothetical protein n=1 Tax=Tropicimonas sp. IMCC34043 TaxID=2248760 RepID=UPI000E2785EC|nr:hypothetical protein [Tropicimonas sp. IMCC34043]
MIRFATLVLFLALPVGVAAQDTVPAPGVIQPLDNAPAPEIAPPPEDPASSTIENGIDLLQQGGRQVLRGLQDQMAPLMQDLADEVEPKLRALAGEMRPMFEQLSQMIDDITDYEAPEKLPNGDILIRRRPRPDPAPPEQPDAPAQGDEIDL